MHPEHVNKSAINIVTIIEKEHARFAQKVAADSKVIIAGISEVNATELAKQTELVQQSMKSFDDKLFKWFCIIFFTGSSLLFAC